MSMLFYGKSKSLAVNIMLIAMQLDKEKVDARCYKAKV
jgi:hypothetical protein